MKERKSGKPTKYGELGVEARKKSIKVFEKATENLFPGAFCVITPYSVPYPYFRHYGVVHHTDSAGSKPVQNYLHWRETDDLNWFKTLTQDVLAMNIDDVICVGVESMNFVDYIAVNPLRIPKKELLSVLNQGFSENLDLLKRFIKISFGGGETADLPDQLRTLDVSGAVSSLIKLPQVISGYYIEPGDIIIGLRSGGRTKYEKNENSGIMCNGITLARHCLMKNKYGEKYPEIREPAGKDYYGRYTFDQYLEELGMTVGEAIISPTRLFCIVVSEILEKCQFIKGLIHNTGGGQTKCLRIGSGIHYIKDDIINPDPIFKLIQKESRESWRAMFEGFNMGTGFEIITGKDYTEEILSISEKFGLEAKIIGKCKESDGKNKLTIKSDLGKFQYKKT